MQPPNTPPTQPERRPRLRVFTAHDCVHCLQWRPHVMVSAKKRKDVEFKFVDIADPIQLPPKSELDRLVTETPFFLLDGFTEGCQTFISGGLLHGGEPSSDALSAWLDRQLGPMKSGSCPRPETTVIPTPVRQK